MKLSHYVIYITLKHKTTYISCTLDKRLSRRYEPFHYKNILDVSSTENDTKYTEWSADVKLFPLAYNSQITTTLGMSPYEMVFNQKPRKPIMFTANSHKNAQGYCQPNKDSICYNLPLHTHDEDHFHHPQILKLASGTHTPNGF